MRILKRPLDWVLGAIFILSVLTLFLAHEDPFVREALCVRFGVLYKSVSFFASLNIETLHSNDLIYEATLAGQIKNNKRTYFHWLFE
jgi:hypothetical protein